MFCLRVCAHLKLKIARWLPPVCSKAKVIHADGSESGNKSGLRLDLCQWQLAWDRYTIGAVVVDQVSGFVFRGVSRVVTIHICDQMPLGTASRHKHNVMTIAERGVSQGRKELLGVLYDELGR